MKYRILISVMLLPVFLHSAHAAFVPDEFDSPELGPQWKFIDSDPAGSTYTLTGSAFSLKAKEGGDQSFVHERYAALEQDAPAGTDWEVETKMESFDPTRPEHKLIYNKSGIFLRQDKDHWIGVAVGTDKHAAVLNVEGLYQTDPRPDRTELKYLGSNIIVNVTSPTLYMKIRKSPDGYQGFVSGDGANWTAVTPLIRNPLTPSGEFASEKIRLFQSGGPERDKGTADAADFDYVRLRQLTPRPSSFVSDDFNAPHFNTTVWTHNSGFHPGQLHQKDGQLHLTSNISNDVFFDYDNASYVYQNVPSDAANWSLVIKAGPINLRDEEVYSGYGIQIWQDQNNWVLLSNLVGRDKQHMVESAFQAQNATVQKDYRSMIAGGLPRWLRIMKTGKRYRCAYSYDGERWTEAPKGGFQLPAELRNAQIRLFCKRHSNKKTNMTTVSFDFIEQRSVAEGWNLTH